MKKLVMILVLLAAVLGLSACGGKKEAVEEDKVYVIGLSADFAPFEYRDGDDIVGFDPELAEEIARVSGLEFKIVDMAFPGLLPALQTKKIDIILSGMSVTDERKKAVNFSKPYFNVSQVIIVPEGNDEIVDAESMKGKKIGVQLGTTSDTIAQGIEGVEILQYEKAYGAILDLNSGKIDAIISDYQLAHNFVENNTGLKIVDQEIIQEEYAMAFRKEDTYLLDKVNKALDEIVDGPKYQELMKKYIIEK